MTLRSDPRLADDSVHSLARSLYNAYTDNHPTIHCNRFPSWSELKDEHKREWIIKAQDQLKEKGS